MNPVFHLPSGYRERQPDDKIIVSCGIGYSYQPGLSSTRNHCSVYEPDTWQLFYHDYPVGCAKHEDQMYAFKLYAMDRAIQAGYRFVMWMDTTFQPVKPLTEVWEHIKRNGWYVPPQQNAKLGAWCSDAALAYLAIDRDKAMEVPLVYSGIVGLDMWSPAAKAIWRDWKLSRGVWNGPHRNQPGDMIPWGNKYAGWCSDDPRCEGHRHDEAALSGILHGMGLTPEVTGFLDLEHPEGCIGHHVPDYDVVALRCALLALTDSMDRLRALRLGRKAEIEAMCR